MPLHLSPGVADKGVEMECGGDANLDDGREE